MDLVKLTKAEFEKVAKLVYDRTGIYLPEEKLALLSNRLRKRLRVLNLPGFEDYYKLLCDKKACEDELPHFLSAVTTNETYFFRNDQLWQFFSGELLKYFVDTFGSKKSLRIWSAASSTGAEAYTAAIALRESLPEADKWDITIIGSDISDKVLQHAREAKYNEYAVARMDKARIKRWFDVSGDEYLLKDEARKLVKFQFHNLRDAFPNGRFHLVFLRNVLMYFDTPMKKRVLQVVSDALVPGGYLIVGDVDPIRTVPELSQSMTLEYQRPGAYLKPAHGAKKPDQKAMVTA